MLISGDLIKEQAGHLDSGKAAQVTEQEVDVSVLARRDSSTILRGKPKPPSSLYGILPFMFSFLFLRFYLVI